MSKKNTALATLPSEQALAELKSQFPAEQGFIRNLLPRLSMNSQDKFEGKGKAAKLVKEAGIFVIERQTEEEDEDTGRKIWSKDEIGDKVEGTIIYQRKQLRMYDEKTEQYTSSPVYDSEDQVIPLFCNKVEVARGTPAELKALYEYEEEGKKKSSLEDNRVLYFLKDEEVFQLSLRGSSMYSWMSYARSTLPPSVLTELFSEPMEKGQIKWSKMTFKTVRPLNADEAQGISLRIAEIKDGIDRERAFYASAPVEKF